MPDIFTSIMILVIYLLCFHLPVLSRLEIIYFSLLGCIAITAHISHLPQAFALVSVVLVLHVVFRTPPRSLLIRAGVLSVPLMLSATAQYCHSPFFRVISSGTDLSPCQHDRAWPRPTLSSRDVPGCGLQNL
jgi:hypothetical protein